MQVPVGLVSSSKTPRVVNQLRFAQGTGGGGIGPQPVLLQGYKLPGSAAADYEVFDVVDPEEAAEYVGATSELGRMILEGYMPDCSMKALAVPEPSGGTKATLDVVVTGTATEPGSFDLHMGKVVKNIGIVVGDTATVIGGKVEQAINEIPNHYCTAANVTGTVTCTVNNKGARGNQHIVFLDKARIAAGVSVSLDGGTAFANGGVPFENGAGVETISTVLAATVDLLVPYSAWAANDSTSATAISAQAADKAEPTGVGPENCIVATNVEGVNTANDLSQTAFNQYFGQVVWAEGHRQHPSIIAARVAVHRSIAEARPQTPLGDPNHRYLKEPVPGLLPHYKPEHSPGISVTDIALNTGVTPLVTVGQNLCILRSITSYSLNGSQPDDRVLDTSDALIPQRIAQDVKDIWENEFAINNPLVAPDLPNGDAPPPNVATPSLWAARLNSRMKLTYFPAGLTLQFDPNTGEEQKATAVYNAQLKCLISDVPAIVVPKTFILGNTVRQIPA